MRTSAVRLFTPGIVSRVNVGSSMGTPQAVMLEQLRWFAKEVMPKFKTGG
jgi:hypothetical protein